MAQNTIKKIICYSAAGVLLLIYAGILLKSLDTSSVTDSYRMFYIDRQLKYYPANDSLKDYRTDTVFDYSEGGTYLNLGNGWSTPEGDATWCVGDDSDLYIYVEGPDADYELVITACKTAGYCSSLYVNDDYAGSIDLQDGTAVIPVDGDALTEGYNCFRIHAEEDIQPYGVLHPETGETRELNLYISSIELRRTDE